jgi:hypothetical protein
VSAKKPMMSGTNAVTNRLTVRDICTSLAVAGCELYVHGVSLP